ncbi:MAG TPA: DUF5995 family protein [Acidimicrobiia bacterium]|nr:DUF5995 family protein [Acidimicrobiia bacterium]
MADPRECPALRAGPVSSVVEVIDRLTEIRDCTAKLAPTCGIAEFSELYLTITQGIRDGIEQRDFFADNTYLDRLDVAFGNRYFDALRAWAGGQRTPRAWQVLFEVPSDGEITAIQLAGAGVNAHINLDLAVATVDTGRAMGDADLDTGTRREDYAKVNDIFAERMDTLLRNVLEERAERGLDPEGLSALGRLMTRIVATARHFAWEDAEELWLLPRRSEAWDAKERYMDTVAYLVGRGLLVDLPG